MDNPPCNETLPPRSIPEHFIYIALFVVMCAVVALAWPGLKSEPFLDDMDHAAHVATFTGWKDTFGPDCFGLFRPFKNVVYYAFHRFGTPPPLLWHCIPLGLYLGAAAAVFALARRLTSSPAAGLAAAALWALSATQVTTVVWMACFNISLSVILVCLAVIFYDRSWNSPRGWSAWMPACLAVSFLGFVSYETAVCIPPVCVAVDAFRKRRHFTKEALVRYAALGVVTLGFLALRAAAGGVSKTNNNLAFDPDMSLWQLSLSAPWLMWRHFSMWFFPFGRVEFMGTYLWGKSASMLDLAAAWGFVLLLVAAWLFTLRRLPLLAFGLAWFFLASFPSSNFIPLLSGPIEDYYLVVPGVGLALAVVALLQAAFARTARAEGSTQGGIKNLILTCVAGFIVLLKLAGIPLFRHQATLWNEPLRLYLFAAYDRPAQYQHKYQAAQVLLKQGQTEAAKTLIEEAREVVPWHFINYILLGEVAFQSGNYHEAAANFDRAEATAKMSIRHLEYFRLRRSEMLFLSGKPAEAREKLMPLLQRPSSEQHYPATLLLAEIYNLQGDPEKARQTLEKSAAIHPEMRDHIAQVMVRFAPKNPAPTNQ